MKKWICLSAVLVVLCAFRGSQSVAQDWVSLFDGHSLSGWKVGENAATFSVKDGHCLLYTSPSPRDGLLSRMPSSA